MLVINNHSVVFFDVDDTIVKWDKESISSEPTIQIIQPKVLHRTADDELVEVGPYTVTLALHNKHIAALKEHKAKGDTVIVWSAGGWDWAEAVVKALQLEEYVDLVINKPICIYDDLPPHEFLPRRYLKDYENK